MKKIKPIACWKTIHKSAIGAAVFRSLYFDYIKVVCQLGNHLIHTKEKLRSLAAFIVNYEPDSSEIS